MIKTNTQTITLDGTEQEVRFNRNYPYFWVQNQGSSDVLMSTDSGITEGKDGVMTVLSGGTACTMHGYDLDRFYLMGTGKVQVVGTYSAHCPFKSAQGGGDNTAFGAASYSLANAADYPLLGLNLYGKSTQNGTPTPENPVDIVSVGDGGAVEVTACGKNLVDPSKITNGGFDYATGTELNNSARARTGYIAVTPAYLVGSVPNGYSIISIYHYTATKEFLGVGGVSLLKGQNGFIRLLFKRNDNARITDDDLNTLKNTIIVTNGESVEYEPYKGNTASITTALPLCSVGDVCDELIYNADGTGKVVKYTEKIDSYNGEAITTPYMSTTGELTDGSTVIYQLVEPTETELTAAEISALREMQTFDGVTNIMNDSGADMDVKFCANKMLSKCVMPILSGLQKQIDELNAAVLSLGSNV